MRGFLPAVLLVTATSVLGSSPLRAQAQQAPAIAHSQTPFGPSLGRPWTAPMLDEPSGVPDGPSTVRRLFGPQPTSLSSLDGKRQGRVLMIVGGAGILAGLILDEGIITVAGAGTAGVGLYLYLR